MLSVFGCSSGVLLVVRVGVGGGPCINAMRVVLGSVLLPTCAHTTVDPARTPRTATHRQTPTSYVATVHAAASFVCSMDDQYYTMTQ